MKKIHICKISMEEFADLTKNGLKHLQGIPRLKYFLRSESKGIRR